MFSPIIPNLPLLGYLQANFLYKIMGEVPFHSISMVGESLGGYKGLHIQALNTTYNRVIKIVQNPLFSLGLLVVCGVSSVYLSYKFIEISQANKASSSQAEEYSPLLEKHKELQKKYEELIREYEELREKYEQLREKHGKFIVEYEKLLEELYHLKGDNTCLRKNIASLEKQQQHVTSGAQGMSDNTISYYEQETQRPTAPSPSTESRSRW